MGQFTNEQCQYFVDLVSLLNDAKITEMTLIDGKIWGFNLDEMFIVSGKTNLFDTEVSVSNLSVLKDRLTLMNSRDDFTIGYKTDAGIDGTDFIHQLHLKCKGASGEYSCKKNTQETSKIGKFPEPNLIQFNVTKAEVIEMAKAINAYGGQYLTFEMYQGAITITNEAPGGDTFCMSLDAGVDAEQELIFSYRAGVVANLLKISLEQDVVKLAIDTVTKMLIVYNWDVTFHVQLAKT